MRGGSLIGIYLTLTASAHQYKAINWYWCDQIAIGSYMNRWLYILLILTGLALLSAY